MNECTFDFTRITGIIACALRTCYVTQTLSAGICHSDVHLASGKLKLYDDVVVPLATLADGVKYPLVFGKAYKSQPTFHNVSHKVKN